MQYFYMFILRYFSSRLQSTLFSITAHEQALQHPKYEYLQWYFPYFIF